MSISIFEIFDDGSPRFRRVRDFKAVRVARDLGGIGHQIQTGAAGLLAVSRESPVNEGLNLPFKYYFHLLSSSGLENF